MYCLRVYADYNESSYMYEKSLEEDEQYYSQLYIPSLNRILHGSKVGHSPTGTQYVRYQISLDEDDWRKIDQELTEGGWEKYYVD